MQGVLTTCYIIMTMFNITKLYDICHIEQVIA